MLLNSNQQQSRGLFSQKCDSQQDLIEQDLIVVLYNHASKVKEPRLATMTVVPRGFPLVSDLVKSSVIALDSL
jgi:hypothetical protein